ncbi:serine hydrolase domain-containing protein [Mucilaginibacter jinjuensis]|uniref:Serine hydrolase n=1 Tax=Mucilaginibacter jinjuensis TaxID=1176721 RepID=A0ABY7T504_9SPHI|nr:serine hydrolase domain-containing protein [Mucilaginibacter jinjuensis]WCT11364.1 serine hydrolase [Mucilaginibacter jinjuensis]
MKIKCLLLIIATLFCQHSFGQLNSKASAVISLIGDQINSDLQKDNLHGSISVAIVKNDQVIWAGAFGYAKMEQNIPADTNNIYRIGSITKVFTAALLMQMVEEGKIKPDDPVENYLPEIKNLKDYNKYSKITFRQLASHTAGLKREPDLHGADVGPLDQWEQKVLACIPKTSYNSKPGELFLYSNIGFAMLGLAVSRAAGVPYMQMVQQRILDPLHMTDTYFALPEDKLPRLAEGMSNGNGEVNIDLPVRELKGRGYRVPNGGIYSTPRDLAKFALSLIGKPALLSTQSRKQMQEVPPGGEKYGLGLMLYKSADLDVIGHNGSVPGYTSEMAIDQSSGYAVILMRNYNIGSTNLTAIAHLLLKTLKQTD